MTTNMNNTQSQYFFQIMDCQAKCSNKGSDRLSFQAPYIWILLNWQIISTAGWLDALISYIASKQGVKSCNWRISVIEDEEQLEVFYRAVQQIAVALGNIPTLEHLFLVRCWKSYKITGKIFDHRGCWNYACQSISCDSTKVPSVIDYRLEALVLNEVRQITKYDSWPQLGQWVQKKFVSYHTEEYMEALQQHPSLSSLSFHLEQESIHDGMLSMLTILLSMQKLSKVCIIFGDFSMTKTDEGFVVKDFVQQLTTLTETLANHPQIQELQLKIPFSSPVCQELFCDGIARMKSLRRLTLRNIFLWPASMIQALRQLLPVLSELTIDSIYEPEELFDVAHCVIYGSRRLTFLDIQIFTYDKLYRHGNEISRRVKRMDKLMEGVSAMNRAGRQYVLDDAVNKRKAFVVLESVKDNLSCLYIHLRESPLF